MSWKFNTKRTARSIWTASIKEAFVGIDEFYKSYRAQQQVDSSAAVGIMCVVSKDYIYVANLGCCGCYQFEINGSLKSVGKRHTTSSTHERFRIMMSGGKVVAKSPGDIMNRSDSTSSSESPKDRSKLNSQSSISRGRNPSGNIASAELIYECYPSSPSTDGNDSMKCDDFQDGPSVEFDINAEDSRRKGRRHSIIGKVRSKVKKKFRKLRHFRSKHHSQDESTVSDCNGTLENYSSRSSAASVGSTEEYTRNPKEDKYEVVPGNVSATRVFGLLSTKKECAESYKKSKLWITDPDITMIKRSRKIKGILLASSGIIDSIPKNRIAWMLNNCCEEACVRAFCDRLSESATLEYGSKACVCSLIAFPQRHK